MRLAYAITVATLGVCLSAQSLACTKPKITLDPQWLINHGSAGGVTNLWLGAEVELFLPTFDTNCIAGLGLQGPAVPSLNVQGIMVSIANLSTPGLGANIPDFNGLTSNPAAAGALTTASPGTTWFGFAGLVIPPVLPSPLGPGDVYKLWFDLFVADIDVPLLMLNSANFAAGTTPLLPPSDPLHGFAFSGAKPISSAMVHDMPAPPTLAITLLGLALLGGFAVRRGRFSGPAAIQNRR